MWLGSSWGWVAAGLGTAGMLLIALCVMHWGRTKGYVRLAARDVKASQPDHTQEATVEGIQENNGSHMLPPPELVSMPMLQLPACPELEPTLSDGEVAPTATACVTAAEGVHARLTTVTSAC